MRHLLFRRKSLIDVLRNQRFVGREFTPSEYVRSSIIHSKIQQNFLTPCHFLIPLRPSRISNYLLLPTTPAAVHDTCCLPRLPAAFHDFLWPESIFATVVSFFVCLCSRGREIFRRLPTPLQLNETMILSDGFHTTPT